MCIEKLFFLIAVTFALAWSGEASPLSCDWTPNVTATQDGTGNYLTIKEALSSAQDYNNFSC
ncbi:unnamed protein product [Arabis nemorensis]|uniref:Uncharacterized protein n=1 Tax=Arabis nemorensis TaxID=586526 RepID=A0A565B7M5_9BRAS|nr:unnamed protein product [Arabis nemorensis]